MNKLLLQSAGPSSAALLRFSREIHAEYCEWHGYQFDAEIEAADRLPRWRGFWVKHVKISAAMTTLSDGDFIAWLDADALIVDSSIDFAEELGDGDIGMVRCNPRVAWEFGKYDVGVMFIRVNAKTRALFAAVLKAGPLPPPRAWIDKLVFNAELRRFDGRLVELDSRFNDYPGAAKRPTGSTFIQAWHGQSKAAALAGMQRARILADAR